MVSFRLEKMMRRNGITDSNKQNRNAETKNEKTLLALNDRVPRHF